MTTSKLPSLTGKRSILNVWPDNSRVQSWITCVASMFLPLAISTMCLELNNAGECLSFLLMRRDT
ncbi:hypothetical protein HanXRQr2_Chr07g0282741 [Helianthus annuus]|uniref:Uncharacterized protein n=1 Tax=Helianthus annuus TaxID=4232 RepID=A0A9K3NFG9_HELAN|nr:hypothetical protein HanXRQr2_Chr07g0282741 [Helianthus annuus]KAJ0903912.1 hypothetical protein HanPSC8_Chr07g0275561 [Helianthus annuus]